MISIVCVYNNERLLADFLLDSLSRQTVPCELITIDNTENRLTSAAQALNTAGRKAHEKYIMFVHQDIRLCRTECLDDAERMLDSLPKLGIAGIAGKKKENGTLSNVTHGSPPRPAGTKTIREPVSVQTVDECLIIIPRFVFDLLKFDEIVCNSWHLYAADYCLSSKLLGLETFVLPLATYHLSTGRSSEPTQLFDRFRSDFLGDKPPFLPNEYYKALKRLLKKHKKDTPWIYTVFEDWMTRYPIILQQILGLTRLRQRLRDRA
jgi:hypothetical protein